MADEVRIDNSKSVKGRLDTSLLLKSLLEGDRYSLEIRHDIEAMSGGKIVVNEQTLYSCLKRLERQGLIASYLGGANQLGARRKYYSLTDLGKSRLASNVDESFDADNYDLADEDSFALSFSNKGASNGAISEEKGNLASANSKVSSHNVDEKDLKERQEILNGFAEALNQVIKNQADYVLGSDANTVDGAGEISIKEQELVDSLLIAPNPKNEIKEEDKNDDDALAEIGATRNQDESFANSPPSYFALLNNKKIEVDSKRSLSYYSNLMYNNKSSIEYEESFDETNEDEDEQVEDSVLSDGFESNYGKNANSFQNNAELAPKMPFSAEFDADGSEYSEPNIASFNALKKASLSSFNAASESARRDFIAKEYKNILGRIFENSAPRPEINYIANVARPLINSEIEKERDNDFVIKKFMHFNGAKEEIQVLGNNEQAAVKERVVKDEPKPLANSQKSKAGMTAYFYSNRLRLYHYGILFGAMLLEIFSVLLILKLGYDVGQSGEATLYILAALTALMLPIYSIVMYGLNPEKKHYIYFSFKDAFVGRLVLSLNLLIVIFVINFFVFMRNLYQFDTYAVSLILPSVMVLNLPLSTLIFNYLLRLKSFRA